MNRRCHNQINENVEVICPSRPPAEDCSSFSVNLFFCISKNLNFVGLHSKLLTLEVMNVRFSSSSFFFYTFIQFHTHHHLPICIKSLIWTLPFSFHSTSLHRCGGAQHPDLSDKRNVLGACNTVSHLTVPLPYRIET